MIFGVHRWLGQRPRALYVGLAVCVVLWLAGQTLGEYGRYVLGIIAINAMIAISLDILLGRLGLISIGHAGFVAAGAYCSAVLTASGWPFLLALPVSGALATLGGLLIGLPSIRLTGFYLAIATLAFGGTVEQLIRWMEPITGGPFGLAVESVHLFGVRLSETGYFSLLVVALAIYVLAGHLLAISVTGRAMAAVRNSEPAAQSIGINVVSAKLIGFALSGFGAGVAGALYGPLVGFIGPEHFTFMTSVSYVAMAVLGGAGYIGAILGAIIVTGLPELFASLQDYASLLWGFLMLLVLIAAPGGLAHLRCRRARS